MKKLSQRLAFTSAMTVMATLFGSLMAIYELHWQSDVVFDVIKITSVLALGTVIASYVFWTLTHVRADSLQRGAAAGGLTGFTIIQLPFFASAFKTAFLTNIAGGQTGLVTAFVSAVLPALKSGLMTFQIITKVSLIALVASIILGIIIAKIIPPRPDET